MDEKVKVVVEEEVEVEDEDHEEEKVEVMEKVEVEEEDWEEVVVEAAAADTVAEVAATAANKEVRIEHPILLTVALVDIPVQDTAAAVDAVCSNCHT